MTFTTPTASQYLVSLIIAGILSAIAYLALSSQGINDLAYFLTVGLIIGHLVGTFSTKQTRVAQTSSEQLPSGDYTSLYVGNIAYRARRENLEELFSHYGHVRSVRIMTDRNTRKPRGYGFVELDTPAANKAVEELDNSEFFGRTLRVSEAKQRPDE